jgi:hypothetical protein
MRAHEPVTCFRKSWKVACNVANEPDRARSQARTYLGHATGTVAESERDQKVKNISKYCKMVLEVGVEPTCPVKGAGF